MVKRKKAAAKPVPVAASEDTAGITIRTSRGDAFAIVDSSNLKSLAMSWVYAVQARDRWRGAIAADADLAHRATQDLNSLGVDDQALSQIAQAEFVQVEVPFAHERQGWEMRIFPWEYVLSAATRKWRTSRQFAVVRHMLRGGQSRPLDPSGTLLYVESAPGALADMYLFDSERELVQRRWPGAFEALLDPTLQELKEAMQLHKPAALHITGIDLHQGYQLLGEEAATEARDGLFLSDDLGEALAVDAESLARAINVARTKPGLVTFNCFNSASRLAALTVGYGATAAVGFQDEIDDAIAELFYTYFYEGWADVGEDILGAFDYAWNNLRQQPIPLRGSGVVLWSGQPLVQVSSPTVMRSMGRETPGSQLESVAGRLAVARKEILKFPLSDQRQMLDVVSVNIKPKANLNYALLHNNQMLFDEFVIRKIEPGTVQGLQVEVVLYVGSDQFPCRQSLDLTESITLINPQIRVPLTWDYVQTIRESVRTGLYVRVECDNVTLIERTYPISLLPTEEWKDTERDGMWLPSFVLPRDPAVSRVVSAARRYLCSLLDDPQAGFDGYQSIDYDADLPAETVDLQVRALWSALLQDFPLSYINPPPSYSLSAQRLRKPGDIIDNQFGTCIDLALLLAACLEYIDIYPVIFLLKGHAFVGYWRTPEGHATFLEAYGQWEELGDSMDQQPAIPVDVQQEWPWMMTKPSYREIVRMIRRDELVPLEATCLTRSQGFLDAMDLGIENLENQGEFDALIDINRARMVPVTPLPL